MKREMLASGLVAALMAAPIGFASAADQKSNDGGQGAATVPEQLAPQANPVSVMGNQEFGLGASDKARKSASIEGTDLSAEQLWDRTVYDLENREVGTVMAVTEPIGGGRKAIVEIGGIFGFGSKRVTVPVQHFQLSPDGRLVVTLTENELEQMPEIREEDISAIGKKS
jgi:hypothetical protein